MDTASTPYRVHQCSKCPADTMYYCVSCPCDLCPQCKENHVKELKTIDHNAVVYREKFNYITTQENCERHPGHVYRDYCDICELPLCFDCRKHRKHKTQDFRTAYQNKRQNLRGTIHSIRGEALFYRTVLLTEIKSDFKTRIIEPSLYQSKMVSKAGRLKDLINKVHNDLMVNVFCDFDFKHRCLKQKVEIIRHLADLQRYEHRCEQSGVSALQFISFIKTVRLRQIYLTLHTSQLSITESINKKDVIESLSKIQIKKGRKRRVEYDRILKLVSPPEFHQSFTVTGVDCCHHISFVTSNLVWVSGQDNLMLTNTAADTQCLEGGMCSHSYGESHTVNGESELIYINTSFNINKVSTDMKTTTILLERTDSTWVPLCVYWSQSTGDLLVGMYKVKPREGKITRFNQTHEILYDNIGLKRLRKPRYVTENNNGDVVVSDYRAVVVTERGGRHRFSYTGHPSESGLWPRGICTDVLLHILICDVKTLTVQMITKDGQFLSHLLIRPSGVFKPLSLNYDVNTHRLWVSSGYNNKVCAYSYMSLKDDSKGFDPENIDVEEALHEFQMKETLGIRQLEENATLLKLVTSPKLLQCFTVTGVRVCVHLSCCETNRVWVSDDENKLILKNTTGETLHHLDDICSDLSSGSHSVNVENELTYIDRSFNIKKLSKDRKTTTIFLNRTDSLITPRCVYWAPSTADILVGMYRENKKSGMIVRYNQTGQVTQTIEHDNNRLEMYIKPNFITENNNGDVVVSDYRAVVVTGREGRYRFSYTGHPTGSVTWPHGICTDELSHILVCDGRTRTVQMLDECGKFLSCLQKPSQIFIPRSLSYDINTHRLWVGSFNNNQVCVYSYITQRDVDTARDQHGHHVNSENHSSRSAWPSR